MSSLTLFVLCIALLLGAYASLQVSGILCAVLAVAGLVSGAVALVRNHNEHIGKRR